MLPLFRAILKFCSTNRLFTYYSKTSFPCIDRYKETLGVKKKGKSIKYISLFIWDHINGTGHNTLNGDFCSLNLDSIIEFLTMYKSLQFFKFIR